MVGLKIRRLTFEGKRWSYSSPRFGDGLSIIAGDNGTGKTTFADLVYYCLGGDPKQFRASGERHAELSQETDAYAELTVSFDESRYVLRRYLYTTEVAVTALGGDAQVLPLSRNASGGNRGTFSDWLLGKLNIPDVEVPQGDRTWRLGFNDYARLIYHNQLSDPSLVYKPPDHTSFVSDSLYVRKTIFSTLTGSVSPGLHKANAKLFRLEKELRTQEGELAGMRNASAVLFSTADTENVNSEFLRRRLALLEDEQEGLETQIREIAGRDETPEDLLGEISRQRREIHDVESSLGRNRAKLRQTLVLQRDLAETARLLDLEIEQIRKILATSERLGLFDPSTCPICLSPVTRKEGECVCGAKLDDDLYQSIFFSPKEYIDLLRRRRRNRETVESAFQEKEKEYTGLKKAIEQEEQAAKAAKVKLRELLTERKDTRALPARMATLQHRWSDFRAQAEIIRQQLSVEERRQKLENKVASLKAKVEEQKTFVKELEARSDRELTATKKAFTKWYSDVVVRSSSNVRSARLSDSLLPELNNREYLESSAMVPFRLLYFGALLHLGLTRETTLFPRFLLVDTPQNNGIDPESIRLLYSNWFGTLSEAPPEAWQIILTTKAETVPDEHRGNIVQELTKQSRLLVPRELPS